MTSRATFLAAAAAAALAFGLLPANAAMPVPGAAQAGGDSIIMRVQDPAASGEKKAAKKKAAKKSEVDRSVDSGTVPKRYRSQVPKQYHHLIPFER